MPDIADLHPEVRQALGSATSALDQAGISYQLTSGFRSRAEQQYLWDTRLKNPETGLPRGMVAKPGTSAHEFGRAVDITFHGASPDQTQQAFQIMQQNGFVRPYGENDKPHWELASLRPGGTQSSAWWDTSNGPAPPVLPSLDGQTPAAPQQPSEEIVPFTPVPSSPSQISDPLRDLIQTTIYGKPQGQPGIPQVPSAPGTQQTPPVGGGVQDLINSVRFGS